MKKTTVLFSVMLLAGLAFLPSSILASGRLSGTLAAIAATASPAPVPPAPQQQKKQQQWQSRAEYDAFQAFVKESDANKRIPLIQAFIEKYPKSDFLANAYVAEMQTYVQLGKTNEAIAAAKKALGADPDNLDALSYLCFTFPYTFKPSDPAAQQELSQYAQYAQHGLEVLQNLQKPAGVTEAQFEEYVKPKTKRAVFNTAAGFVALQQKNYNQAIKSLEAASQDDPKNVLVYSLLGQAYYNETPREIDKAIWNLARATALAEESNSPNAEQLKKFYSQVYEAQHGSNEGEDKVLAQAKTADTMPADFKVAPPPQHAATGNPNLDAFYKIEDALAVGGDTAQQNWNQLKGQPLGLVGQVDSVAPGADPNTYLVRVDITPQSQSQQGTYDIVLQDSQPAAKYLQPGDPLRFQGTIDSYSMTPNFTLTLSNVTIDESVLKSAEEKAKAKQQEQRAPRRPRR
ncbi:MAG TPA: tetratricopeptide repeat protein [Terriglobia bacterium]|jgi:tetratricopeptide (TPR) repeat protein|nr:tetratricopeptide repeat protein [Terriglobia bacterium]